jgi:hypothetical protein
MPVRDPSGLPNQALQTVRPGRVEPGIIPEGAQLCPKNGNLGHGRSQPRRPVSPFWDYQAHEDYCNGEQANHRRKAETSPVRGPGLIPQMEYTVHPVLLGPTTGSTRAAPVMSDATPRPDHGVERSDVVSPHKDVVQQLQFKRKQCHGSHNCNKIERSKIPCK